MSITFANIKHILELLTTTEWIHKEDPIVKLEVLKRYVKTVDNSIVRESIELAIANIQKNIDPNKPFKLTLDIARISKKEAQILLSNLHLMYNKEANFKVESQDALITLLQDNFNALNSIEVLNAVKQQAFHSYKNLPNNKKSLLDKNLYDRILPYCKILSDLFNYNQGLNPYEIARKLSIYFANFEDAENYLKTVDYTSRETILLSFKYELPVKISYETLKFFQKLNSFAPKIGRDVLKIFCRAEFVESNYKIKSIINDEKYLRMLDRKTDLPNIKKLIQEVKSEVIKAVYIYDAQTLSPELLTHVQNLAELAMQTKLDRIAFRTAVQFMKVNGLKQIDNMPNINFEFTVGNKKFTFSKLPSNDMRGFILGKFSNSCQSIGNCAEKIVLDGMSKANAGFYIITDQDGKIRAQSYAWLAGQSNRKDLVLDSFEYLGIEDEKIFKPAMNKLREQLSDYQLNNLYIGVGGKTPKIAFQTKPRPDPIETDLYKYFDSATVYHIDKEIPIISVPDILITAPEEKFSNFNELKNSNRIILFYELLKAIPYESHFLKLHNNAINHLLLHVSLDQLLALYNDQPYMALSLMAKGFEVTNLLNQGINFTRLQEIHDMDPAAAIDLIEYNRNLVELIELGISLESIIEVYEVNYEAANQLLIKSSVVKNLINFGISATELIDLAKKNIPLVKDLINYSHNVINLCDPYVCDFTKSKLIKLYEQYPQIAKVLMRYGKEIIRLPVMGISLAELIDIDSTDRAMSSFLDRHYPKVINLFEKGFDTKELISICKNSPNLARVLINYEYNIERLNSLNISIEQLLDIYIKVGEDTKYLILYAPNLEKLTKLKLKPYKILKKLINKPEEAKFILQRSEEIAKIIKDTPLNPRDILNSNIDHLDSLLDGKITPDIFKQLLPRKKSSALSVLVDHMRNIEIGINENLNCANFRGKRSADECRDEIDFQYDPLREPNEELSNSNLYSHSILAAIWSLPEAQKNQKLKKAIQLNNNLGDILKEGGHNWSLREKNIIGNYNAHITTLANMHPPILQEITSDQIANHNCIIYQNSRSSLVVLKAEQHFKIYGVDLNYHQLFKTNDNIPYSSVEEFVDLFFIWKDQNSEFKTYALSPNLPISTVNSIIQIVDIPRNFEDDHKLLKEIHNNKIEGLLLEDIYDLFAIDKKAIEVKKLNDQFFINNRAKLTLKADKFHEILPRLNEEAQQALFNIIKKYNLNASWNEEKVVDEHITQMMNLYSAKVIDEIKTNSRLNLEKLSELSWLTFEEVMGRHPDIQPELLNNIIETTKNLHSNLFKGSFVQSGATQGLFLLPNIIKSVNYGKYEGLVQTGEMIAGDMAINKLIVSVVKYLPSERAALITKLPIASPIFKAVTIYSIVQLHKELNNMAEDAPQRDMVKHALIGQYATIGLIGAELLGLEVGPAWIVLMGIQLMVEAEDFKKLYKLDISNFEALAMSLGFRQEKLQMILEERSFVEESLSLPPALLKDVGWKIIQIPKIENIGWKIVDDKLVPEQVRTMLSDFLKEELIVDFTHTVSYDIYRLTLVYDKIIIKTGGFHSPFSIADKSTILSKTWERLNIDVSPKYSIMKFSEYFNNEVLHIESNNWFLDQFTINNTIWHRLPLLPGSAASMDNIYVPVSRDTDSSAIYINQYIVDHYPEKLSHLHFSFDAREGSINLDITESGLINMDHTNNAYLEQAHVTPQYNNTRPYLLEILVTHKYLNPSINFQKDITGEITTTSDSQRLTTLYIIDNNSAFFIKDLSENTIINFLSLKNNQTSHIKYLINDISDIVRELGTYSNTNLILSNNVLGSVELNQYKKYLQITFDNNIIEDSLTLGAKNLEIFNVQGQTADYSILNIQRHTQSFNTTIIGNIILSDGTSKFSVKGLLTSDDKLEFSKIKVLDSVLAYSITANNIEDIINTIMRIESNSSERQFAYNKYLPNITYVQLDTVKSSQINLEFYKQNILCSLTLNIKENNIIYFSGKVKQDNAILTIDAKKSILKIYDDQGFIHKTLITHYSSNAIFLNKNDFLVRIFDHVKLINESYENLIILGEQKYTNLEAYDYNLWADGMVYEFKTENNSAIFHNFPNHNHNITINDIVYKIIDKELCAFEGRNNTINGDNILFINPGNDDKAQLANICFFEPIENADIECTNDRGIIVNDIILENISSDMKIAFNYSKMPIQVLAKTANCAYINEW